MLGADGDESAGQLRAVVPSSALVDLARVQGFIVEIDSTCLGRFLLGVKDIHS